MQNGEVKLDLVEINESFLERIDPPEPPSGFVCPECGGALWEISKGTLRRFQCHIGHAFSVETFLEGQAEEIEYKLWSVLRTLKDRLKITRQMADKARNDNEPLTAQQFEDQAQQTRQRAELIRQAILESGTKSGE